MAHTLATTGSVSRIQRLNFLHTQVALRCYNILKIALFASKLRYARRVFSSCQIGFAEVRPSTKNPAPVRVFLSELGHPRGSSPKSCVKSLCSSFILLSILPTIGFRVFARNVQRFFSVLIDIHQNSANQVFR